MIPAGYMAKRISKHPEWLKALRVLDIYSVSNCVNDSFDEGYFEFGKSYVDFWKHNDYWFFDSPEIIKKIAEEHAIDLAGTHLFFYEVFEQEFADGGWRPLTPSKFALGANVVAPVDKRLDGFDVVTVWVDNSPDPHHSPLSCNGLAEKIQTNEHCLFESFDQAESSIDAGEFEGGEPGTLRIIAVYSVDWPVDLQK